jgi:hypothetical protein
MKKFPQMMMVLLLMAVMTVSVMAEPSGAAVDSATIEDIARHLYELKMREIEKNPFKGFYLIAAYGNEADVKKALSAGANPNAGDPDHGSTPPLSLAAGMNPDPDVIAALLAAGADVNHVGQNYRRTALHQAVIFNKNALPVVKTLLVAKPDLYVVDIEYNTPLSYAIKGEIQDGYFDGIPRDDLLLVLLEAATQLPFTLKPVTKPYGPTGAMITLESGERNDFFNGKRNLYLGGCKNKKKTPDPGVLDAFIKAGADKK